MTKTIIISTAIFLAFFAIIYLFIHKVFNKLNDQEKLKNRILNITNNEQTLAETKNLFQNQRSNLIERKLQSYLQKLRSDNWLQLKLYQSGLKLTLTQLLLAETSVLLLLVVVMNFYIKLSFIYYLMISALILFVATSFLISVLIRVRTKKIIYQLPLALDIILRAIKAGHSLEKVLTVVAHEIPAPLGYEIKKLCQQLDIGVPFENAIHAAADRIGLRDFDFFAISLVIQRQSGGSLSDVLENTIFILMRRQEIRKKMKVLTAEARTTAVILGAIPIVMGAAITALNPEYLDFFTRNASGQKLISLAIGLMLIEFTIMHWMMRFKIT